MYYSNCKDCLLGLYFAGDIKSRDISNDSLLFIFAALGSNKFLRHSFLLGSVCCMLDNQGATMFKMNERFLFIAWMCFLNNALHSMEQAVLPKVDHNANLFALLKRFHASKVEVCDLLAQGADIEAKDEKERTPLHWASFKGHSEVVEVLLDRGADIYAKAHEGLLPLHQAVGGGSAAVVALLSRYAADVNCADEIGRTPLILAAELGHLKCVHALIHSRANVNQVDTWGRTALMQAAVAGYLECVRALIEVRANVNHCDKDGHSVLMVALHHNECVNVLIAAGAVYNQAQSLFLSAASGDQKGIARLIDEGADVNYEDDYGRTALQWAATNGHQESACALIAARADVNHANHVGLTALMSAAASGHQEIVSTLTAARADINLVDKVGNTAMSWAVVRDHEECVRALIVAGFDVNHAHGLRWALGHLKCLLALIALGADVNRADEDGVTVLMGAVCLGFQGESYRECVGALIDARADINLEDKSGNTALNWAATRSHQENCELFVERLLYMPNQKQIASIIASLGYLKKLGYGRDIRTLIGRAFRNHELYLFNRKNFAPSIAGHAVAKLPEGPRKSALLEKYATSTSAVL